MLPASEPFGALEVGDVQGTDARRIGRCPCRIWAIFRSDHLVWPGMLEPPPPSPSQRLKGRDYGGAKAPWGSAAALFA